MDVESLLESQSRKFAVSRSNEALRERERYIDIQRDRQREEKKRGNKKSCKKRFHILCFYSGVTMQLKFKAALSFENTRQSMQKVLVPAKKKILSSLRVDFLLEAVKHVVLGVDGEPLVVKQEIRQGVLIPFPHNYSLKYYIFHILISSQRQ